MGYSTIPEKLELPSLYSCAAMSNHPDPNDIYRVVRIEYHYLPDCPCEDCKKERTRRQISSNNPTNSPHVLSLTPDSAHVMGYIPSRNPMGSLAAKLRQESIEAAKQTE